MTNERPHFYSRKTKTKTSYFTQIDGARIPLGDCLDEAHQKLDELLRDAGLASHIRPSDAGRLDWLEQAGNVVRRERYLWEAITHAGTEEEKIYPGRTLREAIDAAIEGFPIG